MDPSTHNKIQINATFAQKYVKVNSLALLDCAVKIEEDRNLSIEVYRNLAHKRQDKGPLT